MRPYPFKIAAGAEEYQFFGEGAEFIFLDVNATVNVTVKDADGNQEFYLEPGTPCRFAPFTGLWISHDGAADTAFTLYIGGAAADASSAKVSGNLQPVGGSQNAANPPIIQSITDPLTPRTLVTHFTSAGVTTLETIVTPAANTNGIRVDNIQIANSNSGKLRVMSKTSAPGSQSDTAARTLLFLGIDTATGLAYMTSAPLPIIVPAGEGLYSWANVTGFPPSVEYEVLP